MQGFPGASGAKGNLVVLYFWWFLNARTILKLIGDRGLSIKGDQGNAGMK